MHKKFEPGSPSSIFMIIACMSGCMPYAAFPLLKENPRTLYKTANILIKSGMMERQDYRTRDKQYHILVPTAQFIKGWMMDGMFFEHDMDFLMAGREKMHVRTQSLSVIEGNDIVRCVETALSLSFFICLKHRNILNRKYYNLLPGAKPGYHGLLLDTDMLSVYTTSEMRSIMTEEQARSCAGKPQAYLISNNVMYPVLCVTRNRRPRLRGKVEADTNVTMRQTADKMATKHLGTVRRGGIIFLTPHMSLIEKFCLAGSPLNNKGDRMSIMPLSETYGPSFFIIPLSMEGAVIQSMLLAPDGLIILKTLLSGGDYEKVESMIAHDYVKDGVYYLSFLVPDLNRLVLFINAAAVYTSARFVIDCYDIMKDGIAPLLQKMPNVSIRTVKVSTVLAMFQRKKAEHGNLLS